VVGSDGTPDRHSLGVQQARADMKRMPRSRIFVTICVTISHSRRPIITLGREGASLLLHAQAMPASRRRHCHPARPRHPWQQIRALRLARSAVAAYSISSRSPCCPPRHRSHGLSPVSSDPQRLRRERGPLPSRTAGLRVGRTARTRLAGVRAVTLDTCGQADRAAAGASYLVRYSTRNLCSAGDLTMSHPAVVRVRNDTRNHPSSLGVNR